MKTILVVDDDQKVVNMLRRTLIYEGYDVFIAMDGQTALQQAKHKRSDLIILDWLMPGVDGIEVARRISRADRIPILMLTAKDKLKDRIEGLDSGADDYLVKPFEPEELLARVRALLRRAEPGDGQRTLHYEDLLLDPVTRDVKRNQRRIELTPREFDLLVYFLERPRVVLERERLLADVWGYDFTGDANVLEVFIGHLRSKLEAAGEQRLIQTVRGVGYVLRSPEA